MQLPGFVSLTAPSTWPASDADLKKFLAQCRHELPLPGGGRSIGRGLLDIRLLPIETILGNHTCVMEIALLTLPLFARRAENVLCDPRTTTERKPHTVPGPRIPALVHRLRDCLLVYDEVCRGIHQSGQERLARCQAALALLETEARWYIDRYKRRVKGFRPVRPDALKQARWTYTYLLESIEADESPGPEGTPPPSTVQRQAHLVGIMTEKVWQVVARSAPDDRPYAKTLVDHVTAHLLAAFGIENDTERHIASRIAQRRVRREAP